jgi:Immunity protein family (Imm11)
MVYEIKPHANHLNRMIDLEYQTPQTAQRTWMDYVRKEEPVAEESAPVLILSERPTPLPDAFEISRDWWCVSARARDLMQGFFGSQVAFYQVPVTAKKGNAPLPSTNFVTFSQFCDLIDWQKSKVQKRMSSRLRPDTEVIALAAQAIGEAFPGAFILRRQREDPSSTAASKH